MSRRVPNFVQADESGDGHQLQGSPGPSFPIADETDSSRVVLVSEIENRNYQNKNHAEFKYSCDMFLDCIHSDYQHHALIADGQSCHPLKIKTSPQPYNYNSNSNFHHHAIHDGQHQHGDANSQLYFQQIPYRHHHHQYTSHQTQFTSNYLTERGRGRNHFHQQQSHTHNHHHHYHHFNLP